MDDQWCFADCGAAQATVTIAAGRGAKINKTVTDSVSGVTALTNYSFGGLIGKSRSAAFAGPSTEPERPSVFIGKASGTDCEAAKVSDGYPFGCDLLKRFNREKSPFANLSVEAVAQT